MKKKNGLHFLSSQYGLFNNIYGQVVVLLKLLYFSFVFIDLNKQLLILNVISIKQILLVVATWWLRRHFERVNYLVIIAYGIAIVIVNGVLSFFLEI